MRKAFDRFGQMYGTQLGQDVIETLGYAGVSAAYQGMFTDMTPEQIALSTGLGVGAAAVGRPLVGRLGQRLGKAAGPGFNQFAQDSLDTAENVLQGGLKTAWKAKLAPYAHLSAGEQLGQLYGRGYGDNIMQLGVAAVAPGLMPGVDDVERN